MVVILQQIPTTDNGKRILSSPMEHKDGHVTNQNRRQRHPDKNSITERSAIYKQRIDSLFDFSPVPPPPPPLPAHQLFKICPPRYGRVMEPDSSEDEGYERIMEDDEDTLARDLPSIIPDSLNPTSASHRHVSKVTLNFDPKMGFVAGSLDTSSPTSSVSSGVGTSNSRKIKVNGISGGNRIPTNTHLKFKVEYLGSVGIEGSTAALQDLQIPLRRLYPRYLLGTNVNPGHLIISAEGLRFISPTIKFTSPFESISVWAAIKFVLRGQLTHLEYAFMPLISDPEGQDKRRLFREMDQEFRDIYERRMGGVNFRNPPLFACITRSSNTSACHAFGCICAEDAIVMTANLYMYLVNQLKIHREGESGYGSLTASSSPLTTTNQNSSLSISDSSLPNSSKSQESSEEINSRRDSAHPIPPPRRRKGGPVLNLSTANNTGNQNNNSSTSGAALKPIGASRKFIRKTSMNECRRNKSIISSRRPNLSGKSKRRVKIAVPVPSSEESSLGSIPSIDPGIEQNLDELIKSCNPSKFSRIGKTSTPYRDLIIQIASKLAHHQLTKAKISTRPSKLKQPRLIQEPSFLANVFRPFRSERIKTCLKNPLIREANDMKLKQFGCIGEKSALLLCSGCVCDNCSDKCYCSLPPPPSIRPLSIDQDRASSDHIHNTYLASRNTPTPTKSTLKLPKKGCCGYDTDSCAESEKCYCSLQKIKSNGLKIYNINLDTETSGGDEDSASTSLETVAENPDWISCASILDEELTQPHQHNWMMKRQGREQLPIYGSPRSQIAPISKGISSCNMLNSSESYKKSSSSGSSCQWTSSSLISPRQSKYQPKKILLTTGSKTSTELIYRGNSPEVSNSKHLLESFRHVTPDIIADGKGDPMTKIEDLSWNSFEIVEMKKTAEIEAMFHQMTRLEASSPTPSIDVDVIQLPILGDRFVNSSLAPPSLLFQTSLGYLP